MLKPLKFSYKRSSTIGSLFSQFEPLSRIELDPDYYARFERVSAHLHPFPTPPRKEVAISYDKASYSSFTQKVSICNNSFEFSKYSSPILLNKKVNSNSMCQINNLVLSLLLMCTKEALKKRVSLAWASSRRLRSLVLGNFDETDKFVTLTFNNDNKFDIGNLKLCNKRKERYIAKLLKLKPDLKYIIVPEYQKRGAVHYHIICDLPYIPKNEFHELWVYGFSSIGAVGNLHKIYYYLAKYLVKGFVNPDFFRLRRFYVSNSCVRPVVYYEEAANEIERSIELTGVKPIVDKDYPPPSDSSHTSLKHYAVYKIPKILPVRTDV